MYSTVQYMKACGGRGSAPHHAGELTASSRVQIPVKHTRLHNSLGVLKCSKTHLQPTRISKIFRGQTPGPPLLDPPLNTMNRAANCLTPALVHVKIQILLAACNCLVPCHTFIGRTVRFNSRVFIVLFTSICYSCCRG